MAVSPDTVAQIIKLLTPFNTDGATITPDTDISSDLNIDSVAVMDFVMEVEDHFNIEIPLNQVAETRTVNELATVVEARVKKG